MPTTTGTCILSPQMPIKSKGCVRSPFGTKSLTLRTDCAERVNNSTSQRSQTFVEIEKLGTSKLRNGWPCGRYLRLHIARLCVACVIGSSSYTGGLVQAQPLKAGFWCSNIQARRYEVGKVMSTPLPHLARSEPIASHFTADYQLLWGEKACYQSVTWYYLNEFWPTCCAATYDVSKISKLSCRTW
jgi:hypothetical protein